MNVKSHTEGKLTIHRVSGSVEALRVLEFMREQGQQWTDHKVVWNFTEADLSLITPDSVDRFFANAQEVVAKRVGKKTALVSRLVRHAGIMKFIEVMTRVNGIEVTLSSFDSEASALKWLAEE